MPRFPQLTLLMTSLFLMLGGDQADQADRRVSPRGGARHSQLMESGPDKVSPTLGITTTRGTTQNGEKLEREGYPANRQPGNIADNVQKIKVKGYPSHFLVWLIISP